MAHLSTTRRFEDLLAFTAGLKPWLERTYADTGTAISTYHSFNRFAVILAAVAQQTELLTEFAKVYTDPSSGMGADDIYDTQHELVSIMDLENLPKGAKFLASHWDLFQPNEGIHMASSFSSDGDPYYHLVVEEEEEWGSDEDADDSEDLNDLPTMVHIHLTNDNQLGLLAFMPEFGPDELSLFRKEPPHYLDSNSGDMLP
ncbi:hypothetical protein BJ085DRAFT_30289 [Dimargaris cristalligena]|uniref:Uncharacterized protein n=1 Tax=Dimargaris cristalligena TaxID=215637 RepID=A0A4P9ZRT8_9FUNG|nr:hypothetical protein BJ085DRAFT_30289 [Dimargaris cristalligena]|eukprot:RKP35170.1 hypothetical protein BJ085DRAFT_30289 [Dimargaris cristalligena]